MGGGSQKNKHRGSEEKKSDARYSSDMTEQSIFWAMRE